MNVRWQRWLHRALRALGWVAGICVISLAVLMALTQLLLPLLADHPQWVAAQLSKQLQRPVTFASMDGRWQGSGPLFVLRDVTIASAEPGSAQGGSPLHIPETELKLDFGGWLLPSRHLLNLYVRGLQLDLGRDADGTWHVNGIGMAGGSDRQEVSFRGLSVGLWLSDLRLDITDGRVGKHYTLIADQLRLTRQNGRIRVGALLRREGASGLLHGAGSFREDGADGRLWLAGSDVDLHGLLAGVDLGGYTAEGGHGSAASWLDWRHAKVVRNLTRFDLNDVVVSNPNGGKAQVTGLHGLAEIRFVDAGSQFRWAGDDGSALVAALSKSGADLARVDVAAKNLQVAPLLPWLALKPNLSLPLAQWLGGGKPHGNLPHAALRWSQASGLEYLDVGFDDIGIDAAGKLPGVNSLHGELRGDAEAFALELPQQAATLNFPHTFRKPFVLSQLASHAAFWHGDDAWHIGLDALDFMGVGYSGQVRGEVALPDAGGRPFLDLYAALNHTDVQAAKLFWPIDSMSPASIEWLDRALVSGNIDTGAILVRGDLRDWPFRNNEGRFEARAEISGLTLDYGKDWPHAEGVSAVANFVNNGMLVETSTGQALGNKLERAVALIPDFANTILDLNVQGSGSGASLMEFVRKSPIGSRQADALSKLSLGGNGSFDFHLVMPLKDSKNFTLAGTTQLKDVDLNAPEWNLKLEKINGQASFDGHGFRGDALDVGYRGQPSKLNLAIAGATGRPDTALSAQLSGRYSVSELIQGYTQLNWLNQMMSGRSDFVIGFDITHPAGSSDTAQTLSVDSTLVGTAMNFPVPLKKAESSTVPLHLTLGLPISGGDLQVALGQVSRAHFRLPAGEGKPLAATIVLGNRAPDTLPDKGMRFRGHAARLDVSGWVQYIASGTGSEGASLESLDVSADKAELFGHSFPSMRIQAVPETDVLNVEVDSQAVAGRFNVPSVDLRKRGVTARLHHLYWPKDVTLKEGGAPVKPGADATVDGAAPVPPAHPENTGVNPSALPPFHLWIGDLRFGEARLGEARLETWPTDHGMHIDQLRALSPSVQINAAGDWNGTPTDSRTHLRIDFTAENLGEMLSAFGFEGLFNGGKTRAQIDSTWPGAPSAMDMANMDGKLSVNVTDGRIPEVAPGVGRLFGLVSIVELPRRLTLDFGDVFGKGLAFDSIAGDFQLAHGNATTQNLEIHGPAAEISIKGRTGLRAKDYDQEVHVLPHVGNSLPIVGAVVGGPIGAAAGFVVQGILGRGLSHAAGARYRITGTWDKPVMTLIERSGMPVTPVVPPMQPGIPAASGSSIAVPATASSVGR
ncbi:YhdP family protein [Dyella tabacisoli]|uniref:TIGR02099 family protein n=1 Tax=Dyella tabacisoli TaxID=2282381 RepID=A0A369UM72_9GAMM|nr:YhdP family protein [Dyella tabacisoli]RDD81852.1 TIGR02099 family protein [Dyella tabacisoli]